MAHDRSARFGKPATQTSTLVGPGSYDVCELSKPPRDLARAYPFLSGTKRKTFENSKDLIDLPGPGSYNPQQLKRHGGVSIDFTDIRIKPKTYDPHSGPGPGAYTLADNLFKNAKPKLRSHPGTWRGPAENLWLGAPPRSLVVNTVPTIPSKNETNGYEINEYGVLVKNPSTSVEPMEFYDVPREESNVVTLMYKGNFWSKMSGRDDRTIEETPGPGAYEISRPVNRGTLNDSFRSMRRVSTKPCRYLDKLWAQKLLENYPAPNSYDPPKGSFDKPSCLCDKYVVDPPPFGIAAKRFDDEYLNGVAPGPGTYDPSELKCSPCSKITSPFGFWSARFPKSVIAPIPGPGSYDLSKDDLGKITLCKRRYPRARVYLRSKQSEESIRHETPPSTAPPKPLVPSAVFKSRTSRFKDADVQDTRDYDVLKSFKASRTCYAGRHCRTSAFASKTSRFPRIPDGVDIFVPGPGIYNICTDISEGIKGGVVSCANKRRKEPDMSPGPQKYCLHPYIASSVMRRSFNVTLGQPKIVGGEQSRIAWNKRCRGKKNLRWFSEPKTKYVHCF